MEQLYRDFGSWIREQFPFGYRKFLLMQVLPVPIETAALVLAAAPTVTITLLTLRTATRTSASRLN